jgi:hypothetical protein
MNVRRHHDLQFPNPKTFDRLGGKQELVRRLIKYCRSRPNYEDVEQLCANHQTSSKDSSEIVSAAPIEFGFVYLLKSGRYYKIGKTNSVGRRERELSIQLPEKAAKVHAIKTDDPSGIEAYWHKRFEPKRKHGEWFELSLDDVSAFKLRKFM